jgi:sRNA-binding regulator protein Hfq
MFDDFDIDYNKQKYLIETRISGALTKLKSAMVFKSAASTAVVVSPAAPAFDNETGALTITNQAGVVYKHGATTVNAAGSPYTVAPATTWVIDATPASGYYFATSDDDTWSFTADA